LVHEIQKQRNGSAQRSVPLFSFYKTSLKLEDLGVRRERASSSFEDFRSHLASPEPVKSAPNTANAEDWLNELATRNRRLANAGRFQYQLYSTPCGAVSRGVMADTARDGNCFLLPGAAKIGYYRRKNCIR
jgi:hypothetical protein